MNNYDLLLFPDSDDIRIHGGRNVLYHSEFALVPLRFPVFLPRSY
jgi:hypothetical protein